MTRAFQALAAERWAIDPSWLPLVAAIAMRENTAGLPHADKDWQARDYALMAGPSAQRLGTSMRSSLIDGVAIIPIIGPIFPRANLMTEMSGATSLNSLLADLRYAVESSDVGAIMLLQDTPGGAVSGVDAFAAEVALAATKKTTAVHIVGTSASAGYWIAVAAPQIFAERSAMIGSIGVVTVMSKQVEPDQAGEMSFEVVSTNAPLKRPDPEGEEGRSEVLGVLDSIEKLFIGDVARGRKVSIEKVQSDFGRGGIRIAGDAKAAGMIDKVQSQDATLSYLRREAANHKRLGALRK